MTIENTSAPAAVGASTSEPDASIFENYEPEESSLFTTSPAAEEPEAKADAPTADKPAEEATAPTDPASSEPKTEAKAETPDDKSDETKKDEPEDKESEEDGYAHGNLKVRNRDRTVTTVAELRNKADQAQDFHRAATHLHGENTTLKTQIAQFAQASQQQQELLEFALGLVSDQLPKPPPIEMLESDQWEYTRQKELYLLKMEEVKQLQTKMSEQKTAQQREQQAKAQQFHQAGEQWLEQQEPLFKNPQFRQEFDQAFTQLGRKVGFSDQEIAQAKDPRLKLIMKEAIKSSLWEAHASKLQAEISAMKAEKAEVAKSLAAKAEEKAKAAEAPSPIQQPQVRTNFRQREVRERQEQLKALRTTRGRAQRDVADAFLGQFD